MSSYTPLPESTLESLLSPLSHSLSDNNLTNDGKDMSAVLKLAEVLPQTKIQTLRCLPAK